MLKKILYVLPHYEQATFTNAHHLIEVIEMATKGCKMDLLIERASSPPNIKGLSGAYLQRAYHAPLNLLERGWRFLLFRLSGGGHVYVHGSYASAMIASLVMRPLGGKVYYWQCEKFEDYGKDIPKGWSAYLKWKLLNDVPLRLTLKMVNYLVTGTDSIGERYTELFHLKDGKIKIVPNGINLKRFHAPSRKEEKIKTILFVHWMAPRKGALELPAIIRRILKKNPQSRFILVGGGPLVGWLRKELKQETQRSQVEITGKVPHLKLKHYFKRADFFIMPSRQEGFPRVLLESMAMGLPFVSTDVGGVREIVGEELWECVVPRLSPDLFADKVIRLLSDAKEMKALRELGLKRVKNYDNRVIVSQFLNLFD